MGKLVNELSWSRTRMSTLKTCFRSYYYQYYLKWDGWSWDASDERKKAYYFTKMSNLPMLIGHAVHETIKRMLLDLKLRGKLLNDNYSYFVRSELLTPAWRDAKAAMDGCGREEADNVSKMRKFPKLIETAAREAIEQVLSDLQGDDKLKEDDYSKYIRKEVLSSVWPLAESAMKRSWHEEAWKKGPKKAPTMFELYYGPEPEVEDLKAAGARASSAIETFLASTLYKELVNDDKSKWIAIDPEPSFDDDTKHKLRGRTIWALPDFARENSAGECEIWDWKTGTKSPNDELQLLSYALYARDKLGYSADKIRLFGCYLKDDTIAEYPCDAERLAFIESEIDRDFETMHSLLSDVDRNIPRADIDAAFPMIENGGTCQACFFKEMCDR